MRCSAIWSADSEGQSLCGAQCAREGTETRIGFPVCWLHAQAYDNPYRREPLRFVRTFSTFKPEEIDLVRLP